MQYKVLLALALLFVPFAGAASKTPPGKRKPIYQLSVSPTSLVFGSINIGGTSTLAATVTNTGNQPLVVTGSISGAAFNSGFTSATVSPGSSTQINVNFLPVVTGNFSGYLVITSAAPTVSVPLSGSCVDTAQHEVILYWNAPKNWTYGYPLYMYDIYRDGLPLSSVDYLTLQYDDFAVNGGETHSYYVTSEASDGQQSVPSNVIVVSIP